MDIIVGSGHSDPSSNSGRGCLRLTVKLFWEMYESNCSPFTVIGKIVEQTWLFSHGMATSLGEGSLNSKLKPRLKN